LSTTVSVARVKDHATVGDNSTEDRLGMPRPAGQATIAGMRDHPEPTARCTPLIYSLIGHS
jgi:hypothetical protein